MTPESMKPDTTSTEDYLSSTLAFLEDEEPVEEMSSDSQEKFMDRRPSGIRRACAHLFKRRPAPSLSPNRDLESSSLDSWLFDPRHSIFKESESFRVRPSSSSSSSSKDGPKRSLKSSYTIVYLVFVAIFMLVLVYSMLRAVLEHFQIVTCPYEVNMYHFPTLKTNQT